MTIKASAALGLDVSGRALCIHRWTVAGDRPPAAAEAPPPRNRRARLRQVRQVQFALTGRRYARIANPRRTASKSDREQERPTEKQVADARAGDRARDAAHAVANANAQMDRCGQMRRSDSAPGRCRRAMSERPIPSCRPPRTSRPTRQAPAEPGGGRPDQLNDRRPVAPSERASSPAAARADGCDGASTSRPAPDASARPRTVPRLGQDLADRQGLHRLRRPADAGVRRAHVHGVGPGIRTRRGARPAPLEAHPASGHIAREIDTGVDHERRSNTSLSRARARSASSR